MRHLGLLSWLLAPYPKSQGPDIRLSLLRGSQTTKSTPVLTRRFECSPSYLLHSHTRPTAHYSISALGAPPAVLATPELLITPSKRGRRGRVTVKQFRVTLHCSYLAQALGGRLFCPPPLRGCQPKGERVGGCTRVKGSPWAPSGVPPGPPPMGPICAL